jgi:hypothetical protein
MPTPPSGLTLIGMASSCGQYNPGFGMGVPFPARDGVARAETAARIMKERIGDPVITGSKDALAGTVKSLA